MKKFVSVALIWAMLLSVVGVVNAEPKKKEGKKPDPAKLFQKLDADGDGKVTLAEFTAKRPDDKKAAAEKQFKRKDKDGDGSLTLEEFTAKPAEAPKKKKKKGDDN